MPVWGSLGVWSLKQVQVAGGYDKWIQSYGKLSETSLCIPTRNITVSGKTWITLVPVGVHSHWDFPTFNRKKSRKKKTTNEFPRKIQNKTWCPVFLFVFWICFLWCLVFAARDTKVLEGDPLRMLVATASEPTKDPKADSWAKREEMLTCFFPQNKDCVEFGSVFFVFFCFFWNVFPFLFSFLFKKGTVLDVLCFCYRKGCFGLQINSMFRK